MQMLIVSRAFQFNPEARKTIDLEVQGLMPLGVRRTSYMEVSELCGGTSGCTRSSDGLWDWQVLGVIETPRGRTVVAPGDWIAVLAEGEH